MDRIRVMSLLLTIFIVASGSLGSPHRKRRVLMADDGAKISPGNSPVNKVHNSGGSGSSSTISPSASVSNSTNSSQISPNSNLNPLIGDKTHEKSPSPSPTDHTKKPADGKAHQGVEGENKDKNHGGGGAPVSPDEPKPREKCSASNNCTDQNDLIACLQHPAKGSKELLLVVQNKGDGALKVNITFPSPVKFLVLELTKHQSKEIKVPDSVNAADSKKIKLNAGHSDCILDTGPNIYPGNFFQQFPSYTTLMTPIYGAYFLFLTAVVAGGTWACCKFGRKRRRSDGGVPYQELEMGLPESTSQTTAPESNDGWDRSWDDDWEDEPTRVPEKSNGNAKVNGVSSKVAKGEGWDDDWDD